MPAGISQILCIFILVSAIAFIAGCSEIRGTADKTGTLVPVSVASGLTTIPSPLPDPSAKIVNVTPDTDHPGGRIPADFLGLSYEAPQMNNRAFYPNATSYINLLRNLGPGVLRFGGNSVEFTYFIDNGTTSIPGARGIIHPSDLDRVFSFARQAGWKVILGLDLGHYNPGMAADEAAYADAHSQGQLLVFEIGNEPDLYMKNGLRPPSWNYTDFHREFDASKAAIRARDPGAPISGPVTAGNLDFFRRFVNDEGGDIVFSSNHMYPLIFSPDMTPSQPRYATVGHLLSDATYSREKAEIGQFSAAAAGAEVPLRYAETNTATSGREPRGFHDNVSDTFAASLWTADYLGLLADSGITGANFHGGFSRGGYSPLWYDGTTYRPSAEYYGMLLFRQLGTGNSIPISLDSSANISVHGVRNDDGTLRLLIINRDEHAPISIAIPDRDSTTASVMRLSAPSATATGNITVGGAEVSTDGTWQPKVIEEAFPQDQKVRIFLPAASAALVTLPSPLPVIFAGM
jgi:hypothetical protein